MKTEKSMCVAKSFVDLSLVEMITLFFKATVAGLPSVCLLFVLYMMTIIASNFFLALAGG